MKSAAAAAFLLSLATSASAFAPGAHHASAFVGRNNAAVMDKRASQGV